MRYGRAAIIILLAVLLTTAGAAAQESASPSVRNESRPTLGSGRPGATADERQLGLLAADQLIRQYGLVHDEAMRARLERIGATLVRRVPGGGEGYRFRVLKSDDVNAMTTPDGQVFVTRILMRTFKADGDLAAVLAHEISHVLLGHTAKLLTEPDEVREVPVARRNGKVTRRTVTVTSEKKKRWEFSADEAALDLLAVAGYPIEGMERVLVCLADEEGRREARRSPPEKTDSDSTHPRSGARLVALREVLARRAAAQRDPGPPSGSR